MSSARRTPSGPPPRDLAYVAAPFVVVRTPLLAATTLVEALGRRGPAIAHDELRHALEEERAQAGARLRALLAEPVLREAAALASPDLEDPAGEGSTAAWVGDDALARWVVRAAALAWPWSRRGLPAAALVSACATRTRLEPADATQLQRRTRIDLDALAAMCASILGGSPDAAHRVRRSDGVFLARGGLAIVENGGPAGQRRDALQLVEPDARWASILDTVDDTPSRVEAAARLAGRDPSLGASDALQLVDELLSAAILVPDLGPPLTGGEALATAIAQLRAASVISVAEALERVAAACAELDARGLGRAPALYRDVAAQLRALGVPARRSNVFRVTVSGPRSTTVGPGPVRDAEDAAALLARTTPRAASALVHRFCAWFVERHGDRGPADASSLRWLPLVDALLDSPLAAGGAEPAPLLDGLDLDLDPAPPTSAPFGARERLLLRAIGAAHQHRRRVWELEDGDLERLATTSDVAPAVEGLAVELTLIGAPDGAVEAGDAPVIVESVTGPSGVRELASLAADDPEIHGWVERHLRAEEALHGDAVVVADLVHLPSSDAWALDERPVLRTHEIPVLGRSGAPVERQLPLHDLEVTVAGRRVLLRSRRLARGVILRHGGPPPGRGTTLPIVDFLVALASGPDLTWTWGPLAASPFLPRVARGRLVLSRARWTLGRADLERLGAADPVERHRAGRDLRARLDLPRWVAAPGHGDSPVPIDLDHIVGLDVLVALSRDRETVMVEEVIGASDDADAPPCVHGISVPLIGTRRTPAAPTHARPTASRADDPPRTFAPGSQWLYAKLYVAPDGMVEVLGDVVAPALAAGRQAGVVTDWFFVRYADPHPHLRVRFRGAPAGLLEVVLPTLHTAVAPRLARSAPWRFQLDTYEREIERYGGAHGIEIAEAVFGVDSDAALALLLDPDEQRRPIWQMALLGCTALLDDLGLAGAERTHLLRELRAAWAAEHRVDGRVEAELAARFHAAHAELAALVASGRREPPGPGEPASPLAARSRRLRPLVAELDARAAAGRLTGSRSGLAASLLHMHLNRLLGAPQRSQELVILDLLLRLEEAGTGGRGGS